MTTTPTIERRYTPGPVELRAAGDGPGSIAGYAAVFGKLSRNMGGWVELVEPSAFTKTLRDGGDVLCRYQHRDEYLLGRTSADTLTVEADATGLRYDCPLPATSYAADVRALVARGDVRYSSCAFRVMPGGEDWGYTDDGFPLRRLTELQLRDVAPVVDPAYLDTSTGLRSLAETRGLDLDAVVAAASHGELGTLLRSADPIVIDLAPSTPAAARDGDHGHGGGEGDDPCGCCPPCDDAGGDCPGCGCEECRGCGGAKTTHRSAPGETHAPLSVLRARLELRARQHGPAVR